MDRAKEGVVESLDGEWVKSFALIPSLLVEIRKKNSGTTVHLDVDQHNRFLRAFIAFGNAVCAQRHMQPLLGFDGAHSKHGKFNGVILTLLGRDGNGQNVSLAMALVNVESERNILWFFELCIQAASTKSEFDDALQELEIDFGESTAKYVKDINPARWTVYGNSPEYGIKAWHGDEVPTRPFPLFGWLSSNFVESDNAAMVHLGIRGAAPFEAIKLYALKEMERTRARDLASRNWEKQNLLLTPYAKTLWEKERDKSGHYAVRPSSDSVVFIEHSNTGQQYRVNTDVVSCSCTTHNQMRIACRHIVAAMKTSPKRCVFAFDRSYIVESVVVAFKGHSIELPLLTTCVASDVKPTPYYKQAGRHIKRRAASAGETGASSTYVCTVCKEKGHNKRTYRRHSNDANEANESLVAIPYLTSPDNIRETSEL